MRNDEAIIRTATVLEHLRLHSEGLTKAEIARLTKIPEPSIDSFISVLERSGTIIKTGKGGPHPFRWFLLGEPRPSAPKTCPNCGTSKIRKDGIHKQLQRWECAECNRKWIQGSAV